MTPFRLAVHDETHRLLGYWWLREKDGVYAITCRHPISREFTLVTAPRAVDIVKHFYTTYVAYLEVIVAHITKSINETPDADCNRPGFRKHHYRTVRRELMSRRAQIIFRSRSRYAEAVMALRNCGWPSVPPPPLFHTDVHHAASSTRTIAL